MPIQSTAQKIKELKIQGATNIAVEGLKAMERYAVKHKKLHVEQLRRGLKSEATHLINARQTEPALRNGVHQVLRAIEHAENAHALRAAVASSSRTYIASLKMAFNSITNIGAKRIRDGDVVMTHCHSSLAESILKKAKANGTRFSVVCTETRPRFQGRITAQKLIEAKIPTTMIVDSAVRRYINGANLVILGCDAISSDCYFINKIGSAQVGLAAVEARTPITIATETHKYDPQTLMGDYEPIEMRDPKEVWDKPPRGLRIENPAFDVVPPKFLDDVICEEGVVSPYSFGDIARKKWSV